MKLSEAIMMNGMTKPQGFGNDSMQSIDAPCALGGALQALGMKPFAKPAENYQAVDQIWPWTHNVGPKCPACGMEGQIYRGIVWHLNDIHEWTRTQIAEWVATVEPKEEEPKEETCEPIPCQSAHS